MEEENVVVEGEVVGTPQPGAESTAAPGGDVVEGEVVEVVETAEAEARAEAGNVSRAASATLKDAWRQVETLGQTLGEALQGRGNVVMVRVNDEALRHLDMLVEAEMTKSRSESAAFLINEGIKSNEALFGKIREITEQIAQLRAQLRDAMSLNQE